MLNNVLNSKKAKKWDFRKTYSICLVAFVCNNEVNQLSPHPHHPYWNLPNNQESLHARKKYPKCWMYKKCTSFDASTSCFTSKSSLQRPFSAGQQIRKGKVLADHTWDIVRISLKECFLEKCFWSDFEKCCIGCSMASASPFRIASERSIVASFWHLSSSRKSPTTPWVTQRDVANWKIDWFRQRGRGN